MAEKVGGIEYDISADASGLESAQGKVSASTQKMQNDFIKVDKAVGDLISKQTSLGRTVDATGKVMNKSGKEVKTATAAVRALIARQKELKGTLGRVNDEQQRLNSTTSKSSKALGGVGRGAGQAGIQVQQFVGQIQGGQSAMLALSQQSADLGFVLGAPLVGAVVGIGASLASFLIPALLGTQIETEGLIEKLEELREQGDLTKSQARELAASRQDEVSDIGKQNTAIAEQIILLEKQQAKRKSAGTGTDTGEFAISRTAEQNQKRYAEAIKETDREINTLRASLDTNNKQVIKLSKETSDLINGTDNSAESMRKATSSLRTQIIALESGSKAAEIYATVQRLAGTEEENQIPTLVALITKKYELAESQKAAAETAKQAIATAKEESRLSEEKSQTMESVLKAYQNQAAQLELNSKAQDEYNARRRLSLEDGEKLPGNIQAEINKLEELRIKKAEMAEQAKAERVIEQEFKTLSEDVSAGGMTEIERIQEEFEAKRALIQEHTALLLEDENLAVEDKVALAEKAAELIKSVEDKAARDRENLAEREQKAKLAAISNAFGQLSSLMNTESKKMFEIGKAAAIAGALVDGYAAVQGAIKAGNKIGGPPLGAAFGAAAAVQTAVQVRNISKQKIGGASSAGATSSFSGGLPAQRSAGGGGFGDRNVTIAGLDPSSMFSGEQVRDLLKNLAGDGADFTFLSSGG